VSTGRQRWIGAAILVLALGLSAAPWRLVDADSLSRLAVGRHLTTELARHGTLPFGRADPFLFSNDTTAWRSAEWLSDLAYYAAHQLGGELTVVLLVLCLLALGLLLQLGLARRRGATAGATALAWALLLPLLAERLVARGELHALWLAPLAALLLTPFESRRARLWSRLLALPLCALLWSQLHASVVLLGVLFAAALLEATLQRDRHALLELAASGLLTVAASLLGPAGGQAYTQVGEHLAGASTYRALLREWQPAWHRGGLIAVVTLTVVSALGLLGALARWRGADRAARAAAAGATLRLLIALLAAWSSQRLVLLIAALALPDLACGLMALRDALGERRRMRTTLAMVTLAALLAALTLASARLAPRPSVLEQPKALIALARLLGATAAQPCSVAAPFDRGPWLLWFGNAPAGLKLYIDPRNTRGAKALDAWVRRQRKAPRALLRELERLGTAYVLVEPGKAHQAALAKQLADAAPWRAIAQRGGLVLYGPATPKVR
jgi:hypothetical protein